MTANTESGDLVASFSNAPEVPFTDLKLNFATGAHALFANSLTCGVASTQTSLVPYSGNAAATPSSSFTVDSNGSGGSCPAKTPFAPTGKGELSTSVAGAHPTFTLNIARADGEQTLEAVSTKLPPGLLANVSAVTQCPEAEANAGTCTSASEIGASTITAGAGESPLSLTGKVYLTKSYGGASFGLSIVVPAIAGPYNLGTVVVRAAVALNTSTGQLTITTGKLPSILEGVPLRLKTVRVEISKANFLDNPTNCEANQISGSSTSTAAEEKTFSTATQMTGCNSLAFSPTISATPSTTKHDSPTGLELGLKIPASSAALKGAVITLPAGMSINPAGAAGLETCSQAKYEAQTCPSGAKVGTVEISTPLISAALSGSVYIGERTGNSYAMFVEAENAANDLSVHFAGSVSANTSTGQLTATFANTPPIPLSELKLKFNSGSKALLANALSCASASAKGVLTPNSGQAAAEPQSSSFTLTNNGAGEACPAKTPFAPTGKGELSTSVAGAHPTFTLNIARADGEQTLEAVSTKLPPGLLANVSAATQCPEAEANAGTCTSASEIGASTITAGAGESPLSLTGKVYLTKSYGGASFGLSIVVPAIAGPYNLGTVVVRAAVALNTSTGQLTITTGKLPSILEGVPLRLKTVRVEISKANFLDNPTNCEANQISGSSTSTAAEEKTFSTATQMTGCNSLAFSPTISATPSTTKHDSPTGLELGLKIPASSAALKGAVITLPAGMSINPAGAAGLETCSQAKYEAQTCPSGAKVGTVEISTPLISAALSGSVYIGERTGNSYAMFVEAENAANDLSVHFAGSVSANTSTGQLTATFANTPPIPLSELKLKFNSGSKALLANALSCASASAKGVLTPNSGQAAAEPQSSSFTLTNNGAGEACPAKTPFAPTGKGELSTSVAGAHPTFTLNIARADGEQTLEAVSTKLPPGLLANVSAATQCPEAEANAGTCTSASEIGASTITAGAGESPLSLTGKVYLTKSYGGASFGLSIVVPAIAGPYNLGTVVVRAAVALNTSTGQLTITTGKLPSILEGVPLRLKTVRVEISKANFLDNPTNCEANQISGSSTSTAAEEKTFSTATQMTGCNSLAFSPTISATPSTTKHDSPTGLELGLKIPASSAALKGAVITLPAGMSINPAGAAGLETCSQAKYEAQTCPSGAKVGTVEISTPLISAALSGSVYIGERTGNSYAMFVEAENAANDLSVHFAGSVSANTSTGQLTATFANTPPIPLSELKLKFNSGSKALLANALSCGAATVTGTLTPTSGGSAATPEGGFTVDSNGSGGSCPATAPFTPAVSAKLAERKAGAADTLVVSILRADGEQSLGRATMKLPTGLLAKLSSVTPCEEPEAASGACPSQSEIGTTTVTAGAGESPLSLTGKVYLTSAYGEGTLGLAIVIKLWRVPTTWATWSHELRWTSTPYTVRSRSRRIRCRASSMASRCA